MKIISYSCGQVLCYLMIYFLINDHFTQVGKMVEVYSKTSRSIVDYKLSKYACYLIIQNSNSRKEVVAFGQIYFAIQTRKCNILVNDGDDKIVIGIKEYTEKIFEDIKHIDEGGNEYWFARELQDILEYTQWRRFENVINKAILACKNSNININDHFAIVGKMVDIGSNTKRETKDYRLSRYACYLITQNGDSRKETIALGQTYFAIQTRKQELTEKEYSMLTEDEKRFYQRSLTRKGNYSLNQVAKKCGVKNFDKFHNAGYKGLYNGETANDIAKRKKLRYREDILDNMGSEELAANLFRITQTESRLKKDNIQGENNANQVHYCIGRNIREVIEKNGGTMPEDLPTPKKSLKQLEKENLKIKN